MYGEVMRFLAGSMQERGAFRWVYKNWGTIVKVWVVVGVLAAFWFWYWAGQPMLYNRSTGLGQFSSFMRAVLTMWAGFAPVPSWVFWLLVGIGFGVFAPALLVAIPVVIVALPFVALGAGLWFLFAVGFSILVVGFGPFMLVKGGRALLFHYGGRWLAEAQQREHEERAFLQALGLEGGALRGVDGQARLMDEDEFGGFQSQPQRGTVLQIGRVHGRPFSHATEKHVLVVASTRGGKGRNLILPNLASYPGSVFVLDPKGENAQLTHAQRKQFGPVAVLDPFGVTGLPAARFNPVALLKGENMVIDAQMMAEALIDGAEDHWTGSAKNVLTALLLHVATAPNVKTRDLPTVRHLLMHDLEKTLGDMTKNHNAPQEVRDVGEWGLSANVNEWASIVSTAIEHTKWLAAPQIQEALRDGGQQIDFTKYRHAVQSVYVCLPAPYFRTFSRWLRLVVSASLDALTKKLNPHMPYPTRFILDEIAQLGTLEKVESALTLSAGYGVQLWGIWQHLKDIERCYPRSGIAGWVSSSGIRLVFATQDNESVKYFAGMTGGAVSEVGIRHMAPHQMLCLLDGQNPLIVERLAFVEAQPAAEVRATYSEPAKTQPAQPQTATATVQPPPFTIDKNGTVVLQNDKRATKKRH